MQREGKLVGRLTASLRNGRISKLLRGLAYSCYTLGQRYPVKHHIDKTMIPDITDNDKSSCASLTEAVTDSELDDIDVATLNAR